MDKPEKELGAASKDSAPPKDGIHARIRRLPESVVNRIAAGEVVIRPSAALKELLENSLDADATSITVTVRDGGLKLLQVCDDGKGIAEEDLELLCERFATSKLRRFEDLSDVATFGFRGEALASISHVSRLSVLTKTHGSTVAYKASYLDGVLRDAPAPTAGVVGTTIMIEDMFYNLPTRKMTLKSSSEEYRVIVEVVSRYAIRYPHVAFICRRYQAGSSARLTASSDVRTDANASSDDNIRSAFGATVASETSCFQVNLPKIGTTVVAHVSSANFSMKKPVIIIFINGRLVECQPLKRAVLAAYSCFLPKSGYPFSYFDLRMDQADVDVNVHPTKKEVRFLHDENIIDAVVQRLIEKLKTTETSRTFQMQSIIGSNGQELIAQVPGKKEPTQSPEESLSEPGQSTPNAIEVPSQAARDNVEMVDHPPWKIANSKQSSELDISGCPIPLAMPATQMKSKDASESVEARPGSKKQHVYAKDKVRTGSDAPVGLYDVYLSRSKDSSDAVAIQSLRKRSEGAMPMLTSVQNMLDECRRNAHRGLSEVLRDHIFVGLASDQFVLLQHGTKLLLAEVDTILEELVYQQVLIRFADHESLHLTPPAPVLRLIQRYSDTPRPGKSKISPEACATILLENAPMLSEYFNITFAGEKDSDLVITQLPLVFPSAMPDMKRFGAFLYHLAADTDWSDEAVCLSSVSRRLAEWYGKHWSPLPHDDIRDPDEAGQEDRKLRDSADERSATRESEPTKDKGKDRKEWILRHIFFASLRKDFYPPAAFYSKKIVREITSTAKLYKVFERC